jgi:hypothetical protein
MELETHGASPLFRDKPDFCPFPFTNIVQRRNIKVDAKGGTRRRNEKHIKMKMAVFWL